eukprot:17765-Prymnesium_polylepis.1
MVEQRHPGGVMRLGMVGRSPMRRSIEPNPIGVEIEAVPNDAANELIDAASNGPSYPEHATTTGEPIIMLVGGRPFELLELIRRRQGPCQPAFDEAEFDPRYIWNVLEGNATEFLARVRWLQLERYREAPASVHALQRLFRAQFEEWARHVRNGLEKYKGQLDDILRDLGPCPPATEPDAVCFWLAALLNPIPALGVAPEIRTHVLVGPTWQDRFDMLKRGLSASVQQVELQASYGAEARNSEPSVGGVPVCRIA